MHNLAAAIYTSLGNFKLAQLSHRIEPAFMSLPLRLLNPNVSYYDITINRSCGLYFNPSPPASGPQRPHAHSP
jgi:hypothetical protein